MSGAVFEPDAEFTRACTEATFTKLTLYICGQNSYSSRAIENTRTVLKFLDALPAFDIVDVLDDPERAEQAGILATPTLIREHPMPIRVLVGDLSNVKLVISALNLVNEDNKITP